VRSESLRPFLGRFPQATTATTQGSSHHPNSKSGHLTFPGPEGISDETLDRAQPTSPTTSPGPFHAAPRHLCHHFQPTALVTILINLSLALRPEIPFITPHKYTSQRHTVGNDLGLDAARVHPHTPGYVIYIRRNIAVPSIFTLSRVCVAHPPCKDLSLAENGILKGQSKFRVSEEVPSHPVSFTFANHSMVQSFYVTSLRKIPIHSLNLGFIPGAQCSIFNKRAEG